jgi:translation elongation factor EF-Ts
MEIALVILSVMSLSFLIAYLSVSHKLNVINKGFAQLFVTYNTLRDIVEGKPTKTEDDIHKENFIKFLSDSRDWAFDYIEDVQKGLSKFIEEVEPQLEYYNQYGVVIEGMAPPHDFALKKISKEFQELKKLLPEETDDRR